MQMVSKHERHSYVLPSSETHWYFETHEPMGIKEIASRLELDAATVFSPDPAAMYIECGEPGEIFVPAMWVKGYSQSSVFAILIGNDSLVKKAFMFAKSTRPLT